MKLNDGGPAFPIASQVFGDFAGMTLRDYFAAAAMQGMLSSEAMRIYDPDLAEESYRAADAMIKERER